MQYPQRTGKATEANDNSISAKPLTVDDAPQIRQTRLILLFLTGISFVSLELLLNDDSINT